MRLALRHIVTCGLLSAIAAQASAQQVCMTYRKQADGMTYRQVDRETTYLFNQMLNNPDPRVRQFLTGTWQATVPAPQIGMVLYSTIIYDANGLWRYYNRTCGTQTGFCSNAQGHGAYVGTLRGNSLTVAVMYSDLEVENGCTSGGYTIVGPGAFRASGGTIWRKVN